MASTAEIARSCIDWLHVWLMFVGACEAVRGVNHFAAQPRGRSRLRTRCTRGHILLGSCGVWARNPPINGLPASRAWEKFGIFSNRNELS